MDVAITPSRADERAHWEPAAFPLIIPVVKNAILTTE
jgi:hypothetical protein